MPESTQRSPLFATPWFYLVSVIGWKLVLFLIARLPVPANDAFPFDGAVVNWLQYGQFFNPSMAESFPIWGHKLFAGYPPLYSVALLPWMWVFGTSVVAAIGFHLLLFAVGATLTVVLIRAVFPAGPGYGMAVLFLLGITFNDRPEDLAHIFGLTALLLTALQLKGTARGFAAQAGTVLALFGALYTSLIPGAFYCGAACLTNGAAWALQRRRFPWATYAGVVALFTLVTVCIATLYPLAWEGFMENTRQTPVRTSGFRLPVTSEIIKVLRNAPVFFVAAGCLPIMLARRRTAMVVKPSDLAWLSLTFGLAAAGLGLLAAALVLFTANYVLYVLFAQVLLAAGLLALAKQFKAGPRRFVYAALACSLALLSIRAIGLTTWGVACARDVSCGKAHAVLRQELLPFARPGERIVLSSAYLYEAARMGVRDAVHSDWTRDRRMQSPTADLGALVRLRPPKLVLTQFDFYRVYEPVVEQLRQHPELVSVQLRNTAQLPTPDSIPAMQRIVQHISWAPVIVDLAWKP